jgi:hypothetical protein
VNGLALRNHVNHLQRLSEHTVILRAVVCLPISTEIQDRSCKLERGGISPSDGAA